MTKRFVAVLAMIATVFAFGIGAAMAAPPANAPGPPDPHPACDKDDAPSWCDGYDGQPGDRDDEGDPGDGDPGDGDPGEGGTPGLTALCGVLGQIDAQLEDGCLALLDALGLGADDSEDPEPTEPEEPEDPAEPAGPGCADLGQVPGIGAEAAAGCQQLLDAFGGGGDEGNEDDDSDPEEPEDPAEPAGPGCADLGQVPGIGAEAAAGCQQLLDALGGGEDEGEGEDDGDGEGGGGASPLQPLCDGIADADPNLAPLAEGCQQVVDNLPIG